MASESLRKARPARPAAPATPLQPSKSPPVALAASMRPAQAFAAIATTCLRQLATNAPGVLSGENAEFVHQMRVALRRLRSAMRLFDAVLPPGFTARVTPELRRLAQLLGAARDWDVLAGETLPRVLRAQPDKKPGATEKTLVTAIAPQRAACAAAVRSALRSRRYRTMLQELSATIASMRQGDAAEKRARLRGFAARQLKRAENKIRVTPAELAGMSEAQRHAFRIAAKRLRYAVEFFYSLFDAETVRPYTARLEELQDVLGMLNDHAVALALLDRLSAPPRALAAARKALLAHNEMALQEAARIHTRLRASKRFWRARRKNAPGP